MVDPNNLILVAILAGAFLGNLVSSVSSSLSADPVTAQQYKTVLVFLGILSAVMAFAYQAIQSGQLIVDNAIVWFFVSYVSVGTTPSYVATKLKN